MFRVFRLGKNVYGGKKSIQHVISNLNTNTNSDIYIVYACSKHVIFFMVIIYVIFFYIAGYFCNSKNVSWFPRQRVHV